MNPNKLTQQEMNTEKKYSKHCDKICSRTAQMGTAGLKINHTDMPYTYNGLTGDIIINPNYLLKNIKTIDKHDKKIEK